MLQFPYLFINDSLISIGDNIQIVFLDKETELLSYVRFLYSKYSLRIMKDFIVLKLFSIKEHSRCWQFRISLIRG